MKEAYVLKVDDLNIKLKENGQKYNAVENFSLNLKKGETVGIIGESSSGKSISCLGILGLLDRNKWEYDGQILINGKEVDCNNNNIMQSYRGNKIAMIMQNPISAFNPVITIKRHFEETFAVHKSLDKKQIKDVALDMLSQMHIKNPEAVYRNYSFQCSGGMLQRVMIALAISLNQDILIADEPTTALDVTIQDEIIRLLKEMQEKYNTAIIMVSHDLGVISNISDEIVVMYSGRIVERGPTDIILNNPSHPYSIGLFKSRPAFSKKRLPEMNGQPPSLTKRGGGCQFYERCTKCSNMCKNYDMREIEVGEKHYGRCINLNEVKKYVFA